MQVYFAYSSNYQTLRISGTGYPQGVYKGTFDGATDPTEGGTVDWKGYFNPHASQVRQVIIEDEIYLDYANSLFDGLVNCTSIQGISNIRGNLLNTTRMFANTPKVTQPITLSNMISINCLDATEMFAGSGASEIVLNNINMKNCTSMKGMFQNAKASVIEMTSINTNSVRYSQNMFKDCTNLTNIYATNGYFDFSAAINSTNMFDNAPLLTNWPNMGLDKFGAIPIDNGGYINMSPYSLEMVDVRIQLKYDNKDEWLYYDPVPLEGEMCIEADTNRFKVGDGAHHYSELPYMYGFKIDNKTILENSETAELYVPIDNDSIIIGADGKIKSVEKLHGDQITIIQDSEGKLFLELDNRTIHVNDAGQLETIVDIDDKTVKNGANGLYIPIDNSTIFVDTDGRIKSKGDLTPGVGLEWESPTSRVLNVKLSKTIDEDAEGLNVNYDGRTIYFDQNAGANGALRAAEVSNADGTVSVNLVEATNDHHFELSVPFADIVDGSTIKYENDKLVATAQVPEVDGETIVLDGNTLKVNVDNDTLYVDGGKLKAKQVEPDGTTIITNGDGKLEAVKQMPDIDNVTIIVSEGKLTAVKQIPDIDNKTIVVDSDKLQVAVDNKTIVYDADNQWLEVAGPELVFDRGLYTIATSEEVRVNVYVDGTTVTINSEGALEAKGVPDVDNETIIVSEGLLKANIDNDTIIYDGTHMSVPHTYVTYTHGVGAYEDSEGIVVGAHTDEETIVYNAAEDWLEVPHIDIEITDGIYSIVNSETHITTFGVNVDHDTIRYNSEQDWLEVNFNYVEGENGIYLRNSSETTYIGVDIDGETLFINSEGKLCGAPNVLVDGTTIIQDENDVISVHYDHDTIVYDSEDGLEVNHIDIKPVSPLYIKETSEDYYLMGVGYDNATITLNDNNELQTAVGGGWRKDPQEYIIATGTDVPKYRHHMLPDDDADYFLTTVYFPNYLQSGEEIEVNVTHDAAFMAPTCKLKYDKETDQWIFDGRHWDSEAHPLDPHGYSIFVGRQETRVQLHEDFEIDPDTLTCTIRYGGHNWTKEYIDNQFVKVDNETIFVNSEGELQAGEQLKAGKWLIASEGYIGLGKLCQGLAYNEESNCIYVKDATDSEVGGVKIDNETLKINENGQLAFDLDGMLDRGLDASTGKIGHTNEFVGDLRQAGDPTSTLGIKWDDQGHLQEVERYDIPSMLGATAYTDGRRGLVPAPGSAQRKAFLRGDGTWASLVDANLFSVIQSTGQWYVGTDRRSRVFSAEPSANQLVIAPLGWTIDRETEGIDVVYATEMTLGHTTLVARSNSQAETVVRATCYWLVLNM